MKSSDIHLRTISQEIPQPSFTKISLKMINIKFHLTLRGANELMSSCGHGSELMVILCAFLATSVDSCPYSGGLSQDVTWDYQWLCIMCKWLLTLLLRIRGKLHYGRDLAPVPLTVFWLNSKFYKNLECSILKYAQLITTKFCTHHISYTVVLCAKFLCDWLSTS